MAKQGAKQRRITDKHSSITTSRPSGHAPTKSNDCIGAYLSELGCFLQAPVGAFRQAIERFLYLNNQTRWKGAVSVHGRLAKWG